MASPKNPQSRQVIWEFRVVLRRREIVRREDGELGVLAAVFRRVAWLREVGIGVFDIRIDAAMIQLSLQTRPAGVVGGLVVFDCTLAHITIDCRLCWRGGSHEA